MEPFILTTDVVFKGCQLIEEEIQILRNIGLKSFITQVPWGVLHQEKVAEAIRALSDYGTYTMLNNTKYLLFPMENWRGQMTTLFQLSTRNPIKTNRRNEDRVV